MKLRCLLPFLLGIYLLPIDCFSQKSEPRSQSPLPLIPIASVRFEGNQSIDAQQLKQLLSMSSEGYPYSIENLNNDLRNVENLYRDHGFWQVKVGPPDTQTLMTGESKSAAIRIPIMEGPRFAMGKVEVKNTRVLAPDAFLQLCPLRKGQPYIRGKVSEWLAKIQETYRSMGYLRAGCNARETLRDADKTIDCSLECTEGKLYRVGKIAIIAGPSVDPLQFKRRLLVSEGGIFNPEMLSTSIYYINEMRRYKRISISDVDMAMDDSRGIVDLTWHLSLPDPKQ
jgi:outer membrane protein insertion porin family